MGRGLLDDELADIPGVDPVDQSVVGLGDDGEAAVLETLEHVDLPQRPGPVEQPGLDPGDEVGELSAVAGLRQRAAPHVVAEVEAGVVDPHRRRDAAGDVADDLSVPGARGDPFGDDPDDLVEVHTSRAAVLGAA